MILAMLFQFGLTSIRLRVHHAWSIRELWTECSRRDPICAGQLFVVAGSRKLLESLPSAVKAWMPVEAIANTVGLPLSTCAIGPLVVNCCR